MLRGFWALSGFFIANELKLVGIFLHLLSALITFFFALQFIEFSPCEKYLVTFSPTSTSDDPSAIIIWDSRFHTRKFSADPYL
jgi:hypothetical protein